MKLFKITKSYQGGHSIYYAKLREGYILTKDNWQYQLEEWGDGTGGGHNYGYRITATQIRKLPVKMPVKTKWFSPFLKFNEGFLTKNNKRKGKSVRP